MNLEELESKLKAKQCEADELLNELNLVRNSYDQQKYEFENMISEFTLTAGQAAAVHESRVKDLQRDVGMESALVWLNLQ